MANLIDPPVINPLNCPIELSTDDTSDILELYVGTSSVEDAYYKGQFWKKPDSASIGLDVQPYVMDLPKSNHDVTGATIGFYVLTDFIKLAVVKLKTLAASTVFNFSIFITYQNLKFRDWLQLKQGNGFGHYWQYLFGKKREWLTNGTMVLGQASEPNWSSKEQSNITESTFPLTQDYLIIVNTESIPNRESYQMYFFDYPLAGRVTIEFEARHANMAGTWLLFIGGAGSAATFSTDWAKYQFTLDAAILATEPALWFQLGFGESGRLHLRNIRIKGSQFDWRLHGAGQDWLLHRGLYTYGGRVWNPILKGSPLSLYLMNETATAEMITATWSGYTDKNAAASNQSLIASQSMATRTAYGFGISTVLQDNALFSINLEPATHYPNVRSIFFETINPEGSPREMFQLYYINRIGGIDFIPMAGKNYRSKSVERKAIGREVRRYEGAAFVGGNEMHNVVQYLSETSEVIELNSLILDGDAVARHEDIIDSPKVWLWSDRDQAMYAVSVEDSEFRFKNYMNDTMFNLAAKVRITIKDNWQ